MVNSNTHNRLALGLTKFSSAVLVAAALLNVSPIHAQTVSVDGRWQAYAGCWEPVQAPNTVGYTGPSGNLVCVVPTANGQSVDIASISNRKIMHVDRLTATGERVNKSVDGCKGWESTSWSKDGHRLFIRSDFNCGDSVGVKGSTVYSISPEGNWVHVQGNTIGKNADARVTLFKLSDQALAPDMVLADSAIIRTVTAERTFAERMVRLAAAEPATVEGVMEIAANSDKQVAQTWVAEFAKPARLSAKELVALADAGMPAELIDIMVAKAYPERFALQANTAAIADNGARPTNADIARANGSNINCGMYGRMYGYRGYYNSTAYDCAYGYGFSSYPYGMYSMYNLYGLGYGYSPYGNYYRGSQPIIIVTRSPDGVAQQQGRAVRGQGYTRDQSTSSSQPRTTSSSSGSSSSGSSSSGSSSAGSTSSGAASSGGSSTGRTAVPKTPPPSN